MSLTSPVKSSGRYRRNSRTRTSALSKRVWGLETVDVLSPWPLFGD